LTIPSSRPASWQSAARSGSQGCRRLMRRHRRSRRKASLTERARCYACPGGTAPRPCPAGVIAPLFSLDHWWEVRSLHRRVYCEPDSSILIARKKSTFCGSQDSRDPPRRRPDHEVIPGLRCIDCQMLTCSFQRHRRGPERAQSVTVSPGRSLSAPPT